MALVSIAAATRYGQRFQSGHLGQRLFCMLPQIRGRPTDLSGVVGKVRQQADYLHRTYPWVVYLHHVPVMDELLVLHRLHSVQERLRSNVAILHVDVHPLIKGLLLHALQYELSQDLLVFRRQAGCVLETLVLQDPSQADDPEVGVQQPGTELYVGMLEPAAILGPDRDVSQVGQRPGVRQRRREPLRVLASEESVDLAATVVGDHPLE